MSLEVLSIFYTAEFILVCIAILIKMLPLAKEVLSTLLDMEFESFREAAYR